jgi:parvulin-like peptidyl-prolyl isomerase
MANREKKKIVTKKHLARVEREEIQRRFIIIITIAIVAAVVILTVVGFIIEGFVKPSQPVAQVNDTAISTKEYQAWIRYRRYLLVNEYLSTYQFLQEMGDQSSFSYFEPYLVQIQNELEPGILGLNAINEMVENVLIRDEADRLGIQVSQQDVETRMMETIFQYYPDGTPTPAPTSIILATPTLSALQMTLIPPTPTEVVTSTETIESEAPTESVNADEVADAGETTDAQEAVEAVPTAVLPTPTAYTENAYNENYNNYMSYIKTYARVTEADIYDFYEILTLRERVSEAVITGVSSEEEKLWARHILFQDEETGETEARGFFALIEAGEDFATVAEEIAAEASSEDPEGITVRFEDLGWFGEGAMVEPFDAAARELEVGEISQPVQTSFGWHVIQLLGRDVQPRNQADIDRLLFEAFQAWLDAKRTEAVVDITPDWISVVPQEPDIPEQAKLQDPQ